jgi:hypothetical protein
MVGVEGSPSWSPDGTFLAFDQTAPGPINLFIMPTAGGDAVPLVESEADDHVPRWSPDGAAIGFLAPSDRGPALYELAAGKKKRCAAGCPHRLRRRIRGPSNTYLDHVVMWGKDLARSIDHLGSRDGIDADKVAYLGLSWGATLGAILPAIENRIRVNVLYVAGLGFEPALSEVNRLNYITRVRQPTLVLNGEFESVAWYRIRCYI